MKISLIVAVDSNGYIGKNGKIPWKSSNDLKWFRRCTFGHWVIMGRKTHEECGALPGRKQIILSTKYKISEDISPCYFEHENLYAANSLKSVFSRLKNEEIIYVAGGLGIYEQSLPMADEIICTMFPFSVDGDMKFPVWPLPNDKWITKESYSVEKEFVIKIFLNSKKKRDAMV